MEKEYGSLAIQASHFISFKKKFRAFTRKKSYKTKWWRLIWALEEQVFFSRFQRKFVK